MFIRNFSGTAIINVQHIAEMRIEPPEFNQKHYCVTCIISGVGREILYKGTNESCLEYLSSMLDKLSSSK